MIFMTAYGYYSIVLLAAFLMILAFYCWMVKDLTEGDSSYANREKFLHEDGRDSIAEDEDDDE